MGFEQVCVCVGGGLLCIKMQFFYIFATPNMTTQSTQSHGLKADQPQKVFNEGHICDQIVQGLQSFK